jgi:hypothetical protein
MTTVQQAASVAAITDGLIAEAVSMNTQMSLDVRACGFPGCAGHFPDYTRDLAGDVPDWLQDRLVAFIEGRGFTVKFDWWTPFPDHLGETIILDEEDTGGDVVRDIHVKPRMSPLVTIDTLIHEIIHALHGDKAIMTGDSMYSRIRAARTSMRIETRCYLGSAVVMQVLGITVREEMKAQIASEPQGAGQRIIPEVREEVITSAEDILAGLSEAA